MAISPSTFKRLIDFNSRRPTTTTINENIEAKCFNCGGDQSTKNRSCPKRAEFVKIRQQATTRHQPNRRKTPPTFTDVKIHPLPLNQRQKVAEKTTPPGFSQQPRENQPASTDEGSSDLFSPQELLNIFIEMTTTLRGCKTRQEQNAADYLTNNFSRESIRRAILHAVRHLDGPVQEPELHRTGAGRRRAEDEQAQEELPGPGEGDKYGADAAAGRVPAVVLLPLLQRPRPRGIHQGKGSVCGKSEADHQHPAAGGIIRSVRDHDGDGQGNGSLQGFRLRPARGGGRCRQGHGPDERWPSGGTEAEGDDGAPAKLNEILRFTRTELHRAGAGRRRAEDELLGPDGAGAQVRGGHAAAVPHQFAGCARGEFAQALDERDGRVDYVVQGVAAGVCGQGDESVTSNMKYINLLIERAVSRKQAVFKLSCVMRDRRTVPIKYPVTESKEYLDDIKSLVNFILDELNVRDIILSSDKQKYKQVIHAVKVLTDPQIADNLKLGFFSVLGHRIKLNELRFIYQFDEQQASGRNTATTAWADMGTARSFRISSSTVSSSNVSTANPPKHPRREDPCNARRRPRFCEESTMREIAFDKVRLVMDMNLMVVMIARTRSKVI
ncbi:isoleucyl tRNA synthetase [Culex quinquefasciatus]|uniref:Isoleucyl tRNA synthetase n=1 Tax=Culex quinquefasciatus TaxID=7176 RepID=B0WTN0_CULQU|nr:isoleucyl tRNA synthetase [Culex quinquefasciatus]|eukprot:XP_001855111.1 isoleucyl tRNA synthetase [Culex quinquefasciatus]